MLHKDFRTRCPQAYVFFSWEQYSGHRRIGLPSLQRVICVGVCVCVILWSSKSTSLCLFPSVQRVCFEETISVFEVRPSAERQSKKTNFWHYWDKYKYHDCSTTVWVGIDLIQTVVCGDIRNNWNIMLCLFVFSPVSDLSKLLEEAEKPAVSLQNEEKPKGLDLLGTFTASVRMSGVIKTWNPVFWGSDQPESGVKTYTAFKDCRVFEAYFNCCFRLVNYSYQSWTFGWTLFSCITNLFCGNWWHCTWSRRIWTVFKNCCNQAIFSYSWSHKNKTNFYFNCSAEMKSTFD